MIHTKVFLQFLQSQGNNSAQYNYESVEGQLRRIVTLKFQDSAHITTKRNSNRRGSCTVYNV